MQYGGPWRLATHYTDVTDGAFVPQTAQLQYLTMSVHTQPPRGTPATPGVAGVAGVPGRALHLSTFQRERERERRVSVYEEAPGFRPGPRVHHVSDPSFLEN